MAQPTWCVYLELNLKSGCGDRIGFRRWSTASRDGGARRIARDVPNLRRYRPGAHAARVFSVQQPARVATARARSFPTRAAPAMAKGVSKNTNPVGKAGGWYAGDRIRLSGGGRGQGGPTGDLYGDQRARALDLPARRQACSVKCQSAVDAALGGELEFRL